MYLYFKYKNAFQWDAYLPLVDRIPAFTAQEESARGMSAQGGVCQGVVYPGLSVQGVSACGVVCL